MDDEFKYVKWTNEAFLHILKMVLSVLPKARDRAIYITFSTNRDDVILEKELKKKYKNKITIVLEHEFWNLNVLSQGFQVTLVFDKKQSDIHVPFDAILSFADKKSNMCFEFNYEEDKIDDEDSQNIIFLDEYRTK